MPFVRAVVRAAVRFGVFSALLAAVLPAVAGSLGVNPIRVALSAARPTAAITLNNTGSAAIVVQMQVAKWTAVSGEDRYDPSADVIVTPPIVSIVPGGSQIVRVGLSADPDPARELAYRLFIEEVPPPPTADYQGLQVALRIGLPLFVEPLQAARPKFQWSAVRSGSDEVSLSLNNIGTAHAQVLSVKLSASGESEPLATHTAAGYFLPGQSRELSLKLAKPWQGRQMRVSAATDQGVTEADLDLQVP
ncbi:molecular chaperone [Azoarcus sp. KH32C]|uniref:fimbrial biogenesis chaperone n=1 Tax=Azoarcus sp. KH32C TaxID=748247 RepID=UPI00034B0DD6|nr:molecular chaperone [Azoarcus sp. KH32C]